MNQLICDKVINKIHNKEYWVVLYMFIPAPTIWAERPEINEMFIADYIDYMVFDDEKTVFEFCEKLDKRLNNCLNIAWSTNLIKVDSVEIESNKEKTIDRLIDRLLRTWE